MGSVLLDDFNCLNNFGYFFVGNPSSFSAVISERNETNEFLHPTAKGYINNHFYRIIKRQF